MKLYIQSVIKSGIFIFAVIVFISAKNKDIVMLMENQVEIMRTIESYDKLISVNKNNIQSIKLIVDQLIKTDQSIHETLKSFNERSVELQLRIKILEQELDI
tara:strand:+ start:597 stop:902 length:306 start_codon:yes stop_codon:yes gene_type:complete